MAVDMGRLGLYLRQGNNIRISPVTAFVGDMCVDQSSADVFLLQNGVTDKWIEVESKPEGCD